jgi:hypothetical protein
MQFDNMTRIFARPPAQHADEQLQRRPGPLRLVVHRPWRRRRPPPLVIGRAAAPQHAVPAPSLTGIVIGHLWSCTGQAIAKLSCKGFQERGAASAGQRHRGVVPASALSKAAGVHRCARALLGNW